MELVGFQLGISLTAIIICLIFILAFSMKYKSKNFENTETIRKPQELYHPPSKIKPRTNKPLSFLDPHQPNYIKREFNYS